MVGFLQFLIAFLLSLAATEQPAPLDVGGAIVSLAIYAGVAAVVGRMLDDLVHRPDDADRPTEDEARRRLLGLGLAANAGRVAALAVAWILLTRHGLARLPAALGVESWVLVPHLLRLAPFFVASAIARAAVHGAAARIGAAPRSLRRALGQDARLALLPLGPVIVLAAVVDVGSRVDRTTAAGRLWLDLWDVPTARTFVLLGAMFAVLLVLPFVLRRAWRCRPLPPGPLRDRLEAYSRRTGFRARDLLVWPTGGEHLNAAVVGVLPRFRFVFLTDALIETLAPDEVEAVFAHEAGHARRGHLLLFLGYTSLLSLAAFLPEVLLGPLERLAAPVPPHVRVLAVVLVWLGFVLGWISRRFEQEADVHGIETVAEPPDAEAPPDASPAARHPFARALDRIAATAPGMREVTGWRHFSIADRVAFVRLYLADPPTRRAFRRHIFLLRWGLVAAVAVALAFAVARVPFDVAQSRLRRMQAEFHLAIHAPERDVAAAAFARAAGHAAAAGRRDDALRWYREAAARGAPGDALDGWADLLEASGLPLGAARARDAADAAPAGR